MKQPIQDPSQGKATGPGVEDDFVGRRQELARLIGHLLARLWLKKRQTKDSPTGVTTPETDQSGSF